MNMVHISTSGLGSYLIPVKYTLHLSGCKQRFYLDCVGRNINEIMESV